MLTGGEVCFEAIDRGSQLVDAKEQALIEEAELIERDAVNIPVAKQSTVSGSRRAHAINEVPDGLAGALDSRDLTEAAGIGQVAANALDTG